MRKLSSKDPNTWFRVNVWDTVVARGMNTKGVT